MQGPLTPLSEGRGHTTTGEAENAGFICGAEALVEQSLNQQLLSTLSYDWHEFKLGQDFQSDTDPSH